MQGGKNSYGGCISGGNLEKTGLHPCSQRPGRLWFLSFAEPERLQPFASGCFLMTSHHPHFCLRGADLISVACYRHISSHTQPLSNKGWLEWFGLTPNSSEHQACTGCRVRPCLFLPSAPVLGHTVQAQPETRDLGSLPDPSSEQP